jgi:telomerase reverse transcriptase
VRFYFKSINSVLKDTHLCLKYEQGCWPEDLGSSVFGYRDAYIKLLPFVMKMKATPGGVPPLYMAVCDISKAYDTIQQEKLCEVVQDFVRSPLYVVLRYASLFPTVGALRVAYERVCMRSDHPLNFLNFSMDVTAKHSHSIVHDQVHGHCSIIKFKIKIQCSKPF